MFEEYLLSFHRDELLDILANQNQTRHFSININFIELLGRKIELAKDLLDDPDKSLEEWEKAATGAQLTLLKQVERKFELKLNVHCRIYYLAHLARHYIFPRNDDVGKFIQISGTVMRLTAAKCLEFQRNYVCTSCKTPVVVKADYNRKYNIIKQPTRCQNPDCNSTNLIHFGELDSDNCKDYQEIKIQEQVKKLGIGSMPNAIKVTLEDDLVDSCQPGDDVTICGIVKRQFGEFNVGKKIEIDLVFKANHVQVDTNSSFSISTPETKNMFNTFWEKYSQNTLEGRDIILKSFCTELYGLYPVKLALAVVLAGGCSIENTNLTGVRTRSESHLLLVGDPGTGKSHLLRFASKLVPRAVLTTGVGSTAAGLTVTATMENGEWQLEAGALVMADGGICCIDEFNSMKEHDRTTIHEAMEQQTISVAKASMVCKLNSRCSILAACNPKGNLDPTQPLSMNVALPSPLLSRFDLVMLLRDTVNQEWDELVMDYILNGGNNLSKLTEAGFWPINILQSYFKIIKNLRPKLTEDAEIILSSYYNLQRKLTSRNKARTTVRLLESLVRLSQGHARLMYHEKVLVIDSIYAVFLVDFSMDPESSIFNLNMPSNTVFPERPKSEYRNLLETVLSKLQLQQILNNELDKLKNDGGREGILQSRFFANAQIVDKSASNENNAEVIASSSRRNENKAQDHARVANEEDINDNENGDEEEAAKNINKNTKKCNTIKENPKKINKNHNRTIEDDNESEIIVERCKKVNICFKNTSTSSDDTTKSKKPNLSDNNSLKRISSEANSAYNDMELLKGPPSVNDNLDWDSEGVVESSQSSIKLIVSKRVVNEEDNKNDNGNRVEEEEAKNIGRNKKKCDAYKKNPEKINTNHNKIVRNANIKEFEDKSGSSKKNVEIKAEYSKRDKNDGQQHNASKHDTKKFVNGDGNGAEEKEEKNINKNVKKFVFKKFNSNKNHNKTVTSNNESDKNANICSENAKSKKAEDSINDPDADTISVSSDEITSISKKPKLSNNNSLKRIKSKANTVYNDMELLKWVPSVNDGFCADLDLDWDSEGAVEDSQSSTKLIDSTSSSHSKLSNLNIFNSCEDIDDFDIEI